MCPSLHWDNANRRKLEQSDMAATVDCTVYYLLGSCMRLIILCVYMQCNVLCTDIMYALILLHVRV